MRRRKAVVLLVSVGGLVLGGAVEARAAGPTCRSNTWTTAGDFTSSTSTNGLYHINVDTWWNASANSNGAGHLLVNKGIGAQVPKPLPYIYVAASNHDMLLAANPGSSLVSLGDSTPHADGSFLVAVTDFGLSTTPESGSGVLARITLQGVGPGVSELTLTSVAIADASNARYGIDSTVAAEVAVDALCP